MIEPPGKALAGRGSLPRLVVGLVALCLGLTGCRLPYVPGITNPPPAAAARLVDARGRAVGNATLLQERRGVRVLLDVNGLTPGTKGVHIHEVGRCDAPSFESARAHLNPTNAAHGTANPRGPHAGDLPNIALDSAGRGHLEYTARLLTLEKRANPLFDADGSALIVHEQADDMATDPDGNSGARLACGVIVRAQ